MAREKNKLVVPPRVSGKKLIAYYRVGGKYDTPLDTLDVQRRRIQKWVDTNKYEIVDEVIAEGDTPRMLDVALMVAYDMCGHVIVASGDRVAGTAEHFLRIYRNKGTPLLTTDSQVSNITMFSDEKAMGYVEMVLFSAHEYYVGMCKEWLG